jgi:hypothetical protein
MRIGQPIPWCGYLFCFILISWGCLTSLHFLFLFIQWANLVDPKTKLKLRRLPKIEDSMEGWSASTFRPTYIGRNGRTLGKTYGIKASCYWEHPWGTLLGTWGELVGNLKGTCWEQRRNEKMELHTNIRHYFPLIFWCRLGICSGWVGHMETGPYACPLKTPLLQWPRTCKFTKWRLWAQSKARVELELVCVFFSQFCSNSGKPPQTNFNLIGNIFV